MTHRYVVRHGASVLLCMWVGAACAGDSTTADASGGAGGSTTTTTSTVPAATAPPGPVALQPAVTITAQFVDPVLSNVYHAGDTLSVRVIGHVANDAGQVAIPSGSMLTIRILALDPPRSSVSGQARVSFAAVSVNVAGQSVPLSASVGPVPYQVTAAGVVLIDRATALTLTLQDPVRVTTPPEH